MLEGSSAQIQIQISNPNSVSKSLRMANKFTLPTQQLDEESKEKSRSKHWALGKMIQMTLETSKFLEEKGEEIGLAAGRG